MAIVDTEGIVTKETKYGDSSRILTVISRELGKISILAGSVRRGKSGLLTATTMFSHSRFTLFKGGSSSLYKLNEGETACGYSARFRSVIGGGKASVVEDPAEKWEGLRLIMRHLTGRDQWTFEEKMLAAAAVFKLEVEELSCKEHA